MSGLETRIELNQLLDFYGPLLTENRRKILQLYCEEDYSLTEIADELNITRQGVSDSLNKARARLADYEDKLALIERYRELGDEAQRALDFLSGIHLEGEDSERLKLAIGALNNILQKR